MRIELTKLAIRQFPPDTRTKGTAVSLAERYGANRHAVAAHIGIVEADLIGNRRAPGQPLVEAQVAERLGLSRTPLR
ncbi:hypothetical protein [Paraburkholderia sp. J12]|uniref:hypothetical protein n=1 Tax=Paraburkholderia sp. J12 TaxID=2805432 RepID=UPI002ABD200F|nr:hypothetical protein [Paraburkholderia sp. J12]